MLTKEQKFLVDVALQINELMRFKGDKTLKNVKGTESELPAGMKEVDSLLKEKFGTLYLSGRTIDFKDMAGPQLAEIANRVWEHLQVMKMNSVAKPASSLLAVPGTLGSTTKEEICNKVVKLRDGYQKPAPDVTANHTVKAKI